MVIICFLNKRLLQTNKQLGNMTRVKEQLTIHKTAHALLSEIILIKLRYTSNSTVREYVWEQWELKAGFIPVSRRLELFGDCAFAVT